MDMDPADTVVAFLNTIDVEDDIDTMANPDEWATWVESTLGIDERQTRQRRGQAYDLRTYLRAVAMGETPARPVPVPVSVSLDTDGAQLTSETAVGAIATAVARLSIDGRWMRVKICPADDCRWAFYDGSRNHSRQWCSMSVCGNRAKVRKHRSRTA
ncbi:CGNR zinc finger domain-containing protein [Solicola gregarius]|uniref:CGNR zinc finger domain-containing protein n=1 Tax=Solicola gregarius TaxID=2908642 RepID=A0AA46TKS6_9ACTN|nr:CGNR zinc finger domain-containing protein [Solicola gregarius]UYM06722.1 CGNR zinc finger domain-containing protein [Solicola gregarius]